MEYITGIHHNETAMTTQSGISYAKLSKDFVSNFKVVGRTQFLFRANGRTVISLKGICHFSLRDFDEQRYLKSQFPLE